MQPEERQRLEDFTKVINLCELFEHNAQQSAKNDAEKQNALRDFDNKNYDRLSRIHRLVSDEFIQPTANSYAQYCDFRAERLRTVLSDAELYMALPDDLKGNNYYIGLMRDFKMSVMPEIALLQNPQPVSEPEPVPQPDPVYVVIQQFDYGYQMAG